MPKLKSIVLNVLVTALTIAMSLAAYQAYIQWSRVDAMWAWVNAQAQLQQQRAAVAPSPAPAPTEQKK